MTDVIVMFQFILSMAGFVIAMYLVSMGLRLAKPIIKGQIIQAIWHLEVALGLAISLGAIINLTLYVDPAWAGLIPWIASILMLMVIFYSIRAYQCFKKAVVVKGRGLGNGF
jgi:hypothetical protein